VPRDRKEQGRSVGREREREREREVTFKKTTTSQKCPPHFSDNVNPTPRKCFSYKSLS
jgi:hypothetical protein